MSRSTDLKGESLARLATTARHSWNLWDSLPLLSKTARRRVSVGICACGAAIAVFLCNRGLALACTTIIGALVSTMAMGQQASRSVTAAQYDAEVVRVAEAYRHAVLEGNASKVAALYREEAIEMPFFQPAVSGRDAIRQFYEQQFRGPMRVTRFTFTHTEATAQGDIAYDVGSYERGMSGPSGKVDATGAYVVILKRTDHEWKVAYATYTCDCPPPVGAAPANH